MDEWPADRNFGLLFARYLEIERTPYSSDPEWLQARERWMYEAVAALVAERAKRVTA